MVPISTWYCQVFARTIGVSYPFHNFFASFVASELAPWFHAVHHTHYARWIPVHLKDMAKLATKHPDVARKFREGHFTIHKTQWVFSSIPIDQAHEQNNACIKGDGGSVGLTNNLSALRRWMVAGPEFARVIEEFQDGNEQWRRKTAGTRHHDQTPSVQVSFVKDVRSLIGVIEQMGNPFFIFRRNISRRQCIKVDMCGVRYCCQHQSSLHQPTGVGQGLQKDSTHLTGPGYLRKLTAALSWFLASAKKGV